MLIDLHTTYNKISQLSLTFSKMFFSHPVLLITQSLQPLTFLYLPYNKLEFANSLSAFPTTLLRYPLYLYQFHGLHAQTFPHGTITDDFLYIHTNPLKLIW